MSHGSHWIKSLFHKVPEKREFDTPTGQTPASSASYDYFSTKDEDGEPNIAIQAAVGHESAKEDLDRYKKFGINPTEFISPIGDRVDLKEVKRKQDWVNESGQWANNMYNKEMEKFQNTYGNGEHKFADPDELDAGFHNAVREALQGENRDEAEGQADLDEDGNFKNVQEGEKI